MAWRKNKSKFNNRKYEVDGILFDSVKEGRRYKELRLLEKAGAIQDLQRQVEYVLIPQQFECTTGKNGKVKMKCIERKCSYFADFVYTENGETIVEDTKGVKTKEYVIKRKLMLYLNKIRIKEV